MAASGQHGAVAVPQEGDFVWIDQIQSEGTSLAVTGIVHTNPENEPVARSGQFRREFERPDGENLYIEAERRDHAGGTPDTVRFALKPDGLSDPTTEIAIDDAGETTDVSIVGTGDLSIDIDGDVTVNADGQITLGEDAAEALAAWDHRHTFSATDSAGNSVSGTTDTPDSSSKTETTVK
ncbi:hypothetical protein [Halosegnis longus]|uniref:hypothetical protein n=1 Tax=Halosegnis longus TaxID=2216012 RepID=UPI00129E1E4B|nr:hypothetical protein [Halosegnis longus]